MEYFVHNSNTEVLYHPLYNDASTVGKNYGQLSQLKISHASKWDEDRKVHFTEERNEIP